MDGARGLREVLLSQLRKVHAYRKSEFRHCLRVFNRLVNGRAILVYQTLGWLTEVTTV